MIEVKFPRWLANVVRVPKKNGKWRVNLCGFRRPQQSMPKGSFPFTANRLNGGCNNIPWHVILHECLFKVSSNLDGIIRSRGHCLHDHYRYLLLNVMPFGLKNAGATYDRFVNMMFTDKLGDTMVVSLTTWWLNPRKHRIIWRTFTKHLIS